VLIKGFNYTVNAVFYCFNKDLTGALQSNYRVITRGGKGVILEGAMKQN